MKAILEKNHDLFFDLVEGLHDDWLTFRRQGSIGNVLDKARALSQYGGKKSGEDSVVCLDPQNYLRSLSACLGKTNDKMWSQFAEKHYLKWFPNVHGVLLKNEAFKRYERLVCPSIREKERKAQQPGGGGWGKGGYDIGIEVGNKYFLLECGSFMCQ